MYWVLPVLPGDNRSAGAEGLDVGRIERMAARHVEAIALRPPNSRFGQADEANGLGLPCELKIFTPFISSHLPVGREAFMPPPMSEGSAATAPCSPPAPEIAVAIGAKAVEGTRPAGVYLLGLVPSFLVRITRRSPSARR
nr:hypothetical protein [Variovorax paradoxus]